MLVAAISEGVTGLIVAALQGAGAIAGVIMAMVGDLTTDEHRTKAMAAIGASIGLAFAAALVLGPWLASLSLDDISGVRLLFAVTVVLSLFGVVILYAYVPSEVGFQQRTSHISVTQLVNVLRDKQCQQLYIGVFVLHYVLMSVFLVVPHSLDKVGVTQAAHASVYLVIMLGAFVVMVPLMIVGERKQVVKLIIRLSIVLLMASVLLLLSQSAVKYWLLFSLFVFFIAFNYLEANLPSLLTKQLPAEYKGTGSGVFATCQFLGAALGGIVSGVLYQYWGVFALFVPALLLMLFWLIYSRYMVIPIKNSRV